MKRFLPLLCLAAMATGLASCTSHYSEVDDYQYQHTVAGPRGHTTYTTETHRKYRAHHSPTTSRGYVGTHHGRYFEWTSIGHRHPYNINKYQAYPPVNSGVLPR